MSRAQDKDVSESAAPTDEPAGKVEFDGRGKAIWRWAREKIDSTSVLLKRLENQNLALEPTQKVPVVRDKPAQKKGGPPVPKLEMAPDRAPTRSADPRAPSSRDPKRREGGGGGFDPYNSR